MCSVAFALLSNAIACLKFPSHKARFRACPCSSAVLLSICTTSSVGELFSDLSGMDGGEAGILKPVWFMVSIGVSVPFVGSPGLPSEVPMKVLVLEKDPHVAAIDSTQIKTVLKMVRRHLGRGGSPTPVGSFSQTATQMPWLERDHFVEAGRCRQAEPVGYG